MRLRRPYTACEHRFDTSIPEGLHRICFRHPAYDDSNNILFGLFGFDSPEGGLHHQTAHQACAIIANNCFDGYLATSSTGARIDETEVLLEDDYYFIVPHPSTTTTSLLTPPVLNAIESPPPPSSYRTATLSMGQTPALGLVPTPSIPPYRYPVVPSFRHWHFPHDKLPAPWESLRSSESQAVRSGSNAVAMRDISCRMTEHVESCDEAHIVPKSEGDWFNDEQMDRYGEGNREGDAGVNDYSNQLLLRTDLHRSFDQRQFAFVPKLDENGATCLTTHVIRNSKEIRRLYHNVRLHIVDVAPEYLLARFAYTIFPLLKSFLDRKPSRLLSLIEEMVPKVKEVKGSDCSSYAMLPNSRNNSPTKGGSPTKRARGARDEEVDELENNSTPPTKRIRQEAHGSQTSGDEGPLAAMSPPVAAISGSTLVSTKADALDFRKLRKHWLAEERARSDPDNTWQQEQDWLDELRDAGGGIDAEEMPRYLAACGFELIPNADQIET